MLTAVLVASVLAVSAQTGNNSESDQDDFEFESNSVNSTARGEYLGDACDMSCNLDLINVICQPETKRCECVKGYPVRLGPSTGCAKPVNIGDQCFYQETCEYTDLNSDCVQVKHNALCQCKKGYHAVTLARPKRIFCSEDVVVIATDMTTLLGVASGMAVLTGLLCFTLKLFVGSRPRRYASGNIGHPILFAQPTGMTGVSVLRGGCTRASRGGCVPSSRAGAARTAAILLISCHLSPSHGNHNHNRRASVHSSTSSTKSFSARQFERERENRLLARARNRERDGNTPSPSPRSTENLLDDPLPSETWPKTDQEKGVNSEAFTPDALKNGSAGSEPVQLIDDPLSMAEDDSEAVVTSASPPPYKEHPSPTRRH